MKGSSKKEYTRTSADQVGLGQLSLVEHALCPLDTRVSLSENLRYECEYHFVDASRQCQTARVRVHCPEGLSPSDELYLWGLLAIAFESIETGGDLHATPHYVLRRLGVITGRSKGGKNYQLFREALRRLAAVRYQNECFYDPICREHRQVSFGFFSYSLPLNPDSSRAWRIVWDPLFFELCQATGSRLQFDLAVYRKLDHASRRLFMVLHKVFWRRALSPHFEVRHLAVNVLGFSDSLTNRTLKSKLKRCAATLLEQEIIAVDQVESVFGKRPKGKCYAQFCRGAYFATGPGARRPKKSESPLRDPLISIGFDEQSVMRILKRYSTEQIQLWSDVTLAAMERKGPHFFRRSPQAYFMNNIKSAAECGRTPPDWFWAMRKEEDRRRARIARSTNQVRKSNTDGNQVTPILPSRAFLVDKNAASVVTEMTAQFRAAGQSAADAKRNAERFAAEYSDHKSSRR